MINGILQGLLLAAAVAVGLRLTPRASAALRYCVWFATLIAMLVLMAPEPAAESAGDYVVPAPRGIDWLPLAWGAVSAALLLRVAAGVLAMWRLRRSAFRDPALPAEGAWVSARLRTPAVTGLLRPVVVFPADWAERIDARDVAAIHAHEAAHIHRGDSWTLLGQRIAQSVFFFHPGVWIAGRQLDLEREIACDDAAARESGAAAFAECLGRLAACARPEAGLAAASSRKQIFRRVSMLLNSNRNTDPVLPRFRAAICVAAIGAFAFAAIHLTPSIVLAQDPPPLPPEPPVANDAPPLPPLAPRAPRAPRAASAELPRLPPDAGRPPSAPRAARRPMAATAEQPPPPPPPPPPAERIVDIRRMHDEAFRWVHSFRRQLLRLFA